MKVLKGSERAVTPTPPEQEHTQDRNDLPWQLSTAINVLRFTYWVLTPTGFLVTLYGLNVVAWGGMLFLLICNASPAMCHPSCNDINSPNRKWIEVDSQVLNALFSLPGFGLAPWRFRDMYWWVGWRVGGAKTKSCQALERLAEIHQNWVRLPELLPVTPPAQLLQLELGVTAEPTPDSPRSLASQSSTQCAPRAPPTALWKLDFVIWSNLWNTIFQACLAGCMWGLNRYNRPSWTTGLFVALACAASGASGIMILLETKRTERTEGVRRSAREKAIRHRILGKYGATIRSHGICRV
ncbi:hypothetical protein BDV23DRAFT_178502 [Aspergillus alliaceus]|uniref:Uncharacterized protein n=1 Tax=Petromyces alliaceus TaxID=209559 RepID=A0A5N7CNI3_PETAA|nr:hypothetical protein BDV23DRAFT_178502 [Aspergillus alliaceus]